jgi:hypothetical protein
MFVEDICKKYVQMEGYQSLMGDQPRALGV